MWEREGEREGERMLRGYARIFFVLMVVSTLVAIYLVRHNDGQMVQRCKEAGYTVVKDQGAHACIDPSTSKTVKP